MLENTIITKFHFASEESEDSVRNHVPIDSESEVKGNCNLEADSLMLLLVHCRHEKKKAISKQPHHTIQHTINIRPSFWPSTTLTEHNGQYLTFTSLGPPFAL